jgi:mannose-1-phosphate guanylyltransferase
MLHAMIMAGGGGTRFWPRSRAARPKQFLTFSGQRTLLQGTLDRIEAQVPHDRTWVITGATHRDEAARQLPELPRDRVVGEPIGRDTAMCIALGAALIAKQDPDAVMAVMPADHVIEPAREFARGLHAAEQLANESPNALITFGIAPTFPSPNYGYIQCGETVGHKQGCQAFRVKQFKEKPDEETAKGYLASGEYFWNAGIFVWKVRAILAELERQRPKLLALAQRIAAAWATPRQDEVFRHEYESAEKVSIDFAVMEHAREVLMIRAPFGWDDVGSWLALERHHPQDKAGNTVHAVHVGMDTNGCVVVSEPGRVVATIGVNDLIIIQDGDATLIAHRDREADVKKIVEQLKKSKELEQFL